MMSVLVLACVCMLPALVVAEVYSLGGCDANFNDQLDQVALTQEGVMKMAAFGAAGPSSLYVWNPSSAEKAFKNLALSLSMTAKTFSLSYKNSTNGTVTIAGNATYQQTPKIMLKLDTGINRNTYQGIFSFNDKGVADLYPLYISTTDVILRGCNGAFLGKQESLYVFTTNNYTSLNTSCAIQAVKTLNRWTVTAA